MNWLAAVWTVFRFECRRSVSPSRLVIWSGLVAFPPVIVFLVHLSPPLPNPDVAVVLDDALQFALAGTSCLLALVLWATPIVSEERAANTWSYLAVRSCGVSAVLIGKYLNAVLWATTCTCLAIAIAVAVGRPPQSFTLAMILIALTLLGAPAYGAVFVLLGVAFDRIAMALAFMYALLLEVVVASIPAVVNQITIRYRLQSLLVEWRGDVWPEGELKKALTSEQPAWQQLAALVGLTLLLLGVGLVIMRLRELARPERG